MQMQITRNRNQLLISIPVEAEINDYLLMELKFQLLVEKWKEESRFFSFTKDIVTTESYQAIIQMGTPVIPLILRLLEHNPRHWFYALKQLTNENPVQTKSKGNIKLMAKDWIEWGKSRKLL